MKNKLVIILLLCVFQLAAKAQQTYQLDVKKSTILWNNGKTMGGHYGYLLFNAGNLNYNTLGEPVDGTFTMEMSSMHASDGDEANQKSVDKELKTPGFFDMGQYPKSTMAVKHIIRIGTSTNYKVTGDLTMKGITNPIEFIAVIIKRGNVINAKATLGVDRTKWNIDFQSKPKQWNYLEAVKDKVVPAEIAITLNLVFGKYII